MANSLPERVVDQPQQQNQHRDHENLKGHLEDLVHHDEWDLDGNFEWNTARLVNHSCEPNCEAQIDEELKIWLVSLRDIGQGEELSFNYGFDLEDYGKHPCRCKSKKCVGYIVGEDYWPKLRKKLKKKKAKAEKKAEKERERLSALSADS